MYIIVNENRHSVLRRIVTDDTIKYISVTPHVDVSEINGSIKMYRDDGFLLSEDDPSGFAYVTMTGTLLKLTNKETVTPVYTPTVENRLTALENAIKEGLEL